MTMITGTHATIYAHDPDKARAFFRDVLNLPNVDAHGGWLIFKLPPAELGIHPADGATGPLDGTADGRHELYLMCDNLDGTMADLSERDVEFTAPVQELGFGLLTRLRVPGAGEIGLYQPKHPTAYGLG
jgi:catechol 2,3-dioxygenase-like lactoylglutathione lyase family enzyme